MTAFGKLRRLRKETARVNRIIEEEFEHVEAEDRRYRRDGEFAMRESNAEKSSISLQDLLI